MTIQQFRQVSIVILIIAWLIPSWVNVDLIGIVVASPNPYTQVVIQNSPNDPRFSQQTNLTQVNFPSAWDKTTGSSNLIIAVIDTGVNIDHEDLRYRIWVNQKETPNNGIDDDHNGYIDDYRGYNFITNNTDISDQNGHGTGIASIIAANTNNAVGMAGINWQSQIMVLKALNVSGGGEYSDVARALHYATDNGAKVVNMSFGTYFDSTELQEAIDYALDKGVTIVAAAGNNNQNQLLFPASYHRVISAGAVDEAGHRASFSNFGNGLDVMAPGLNVLMANYVGGNAYVYGSGTSFAAAHVTGLASLILSRNPSLSPAQVEDIIKSTATSNSNVLEYGNGVINAGSALGSAQASEHISAEISASAPRATADGRSSIAVYIKVLNNGVPISNHQVRAYVNGAVVINGETVDNRDIYIGTTNSSGRISFPVTSGVAGTKNFIFSDITAGVSLGDLTLNFDKLTGPPVYKVTWINQNRPASVNPNEQVSMWLELRNDGNTAWQGSESNSNGQLRLGTARPLDRSSQLYNQTWLSNNRVGTLQQAVVNPGEIGRFNFTITAPTQPSTYKEYFRPVIEYVSWLPDLGIYWEITVSPNGVNSQSTDYQAELIRQSTNLVLLPNQTSLVSLTVKNIGSATWAVPIQSDYGTVKLGTTDPYDRVSRIWSSGWLSQNRVTNTSFAISPGGQLDLLFTIKAPSQPGTYKESFRLVSEYITWFGPTITWQITVQ